MRENIPSDVYVNQDKAVCDLQPLIYIPRFYDFQHKLFISIFNSCSDYITNQLDFNQYFSGENYLWRRLGYGKSEDCRNLRYLRK